MKHLENWTKNKHSQKIFLQCWLPDTAKASICLIHGQSDHSGRYIHVAEYMVQHAFAFFSADLVGHGKSGGLRGHIKSFDDYTETIDMLLTEAKNKFPDKPVFIYGHSMGGNIALHHAFKNADKSVKGYIISAPWIRLAFEPPAWKIKLGKTVQSVLPFLQQGNEVKHENISRDADVVKKYKTDKLVHGKISARAFFETFEKGKNILNNGKNLKYPVLLLHGKADKLTDYAASGEFAKTNKKFIQHAEFEGLYHEIHNEPEKDVVFKTITEWMDKQLAN